MRYILFLTFVFLSLNLQAQQADSLEANLSSPYHTVKYHLVHLQPNNFEPATAGQVFDPAEVSEKRAAELAVMLKRIYDGEGIYIDLDEVPSNPDYNDSTSSRYARNRYEVSSLFPEIYLEKRGDKWYYSRETVQELPVIYDMVFPFGSDRFIDWITTGSHDFLGMTKRQLLAILLQILFGLILFRVTTFLFSRSVNTLMARMGKEHIGRKYILPVARPLASLVVILWLLLTIPVLQIPIGVGRYLSVALRTLLPVYVTMLLYRLVDLLSLYFTRLASRTETTLDDQLVPLVRKSLKAFVILIGGLWILSALNVPIIPLLTGLSLGGLAFALAAQDTLKNFFGSLMIFIDKPFQIGDWITADNLDGTVEEVGFRSTRIRTFRDSVQSIPNGKLADMLIDNHGLRVYRRFSTTLSITYDTPPDRIDLFTKGLRKIVDNHPETRKDFYMVQLNQFGASSLDILFYIFFKVPNWQEELRCRHEVMLETIRLAEHLGVRFAFPTQTLHLETSPEKQSLTPQYQQVDEKLKQQMMSYLESRKTAGMDGL